MKTGTRISLRANAYRSHLKAEVRLLRDTALAMGTAEDLTGALKTILEELCTFTHWSMGEVWLPDAQGKHLVCSPAWYAQAEGLEAFRRGSKPLRFRRGTGLPGRVWATGAPLWVRNVSREIWFPRASLARSAGLRTAVAIPVLGNGQVVAVLVFFQRKEHPEDASLIRLVSGVAAQLGNLFLRKRAEEELRRSEARYRQIVDIAYEGVAVADARGRVVYANRRMAEMLDYRVEEILNRHSLDFVFEEDRAEAEWLLRVRPERPPEQFEFRLRRKDNTELWAIIAVTPILNEHGKYTGTLGLVTDISERKRMEAALRDNEQLFRRVLDTLPVGVWIADAQGRIVIENPAGRRIWGGARHVGPERFDEYKAWWYDTRQPVTAEDWALARAIRRGETSLNEVLEIEAFDGTRKIINNSAMPLRGLDGKINGGVAVNEDITERVRLETERTRALARESRIAIELQECFRPSVTPHLPGYVLGHTYRAALDEAQLGGDFYDVFPLGADRFGIVIGDVSGKGLDAAVHAVMAKYFLRGYAAEYADPVPVVRLMNEALAQELEESHFLTLFYGVLEAPSGRLRYVNAGHEPALLLSPGGNTPLEVGTTGPLVGALLDLEFAEEAIDLLPGASLLLYTDGVTDARRDRLFLQARGLIELFVPGTSRYQGQGLVDHLLLEVEAFARGDLRDDITFLLLQRSGVPENEP